MSDTKFDEGSLVGRKIGTYEIQGIIGHGGMGYVYRALDISLDRTVALKILKPDLNNDKEFEGRFIREARALAELDHPNVVQVYSAGRFQDILFIAMQFAPGRTLDQYVREKKHLSIRESLTILRQVAQALDFAHKRGLMHRDIKPTNIMIDDAGRVKVMDFGLAKSVMTLDGLTQNGTFYGTPEYGSPEQCETSRIDVRTDIFSLGVVFYEMLSGKLPFVAETPLALFKKISEEQPISVRLLNPRVPKAVENLCLRMMEKDREKRIQSAHQVIEQIDVILQSTLVRKADTSRRANPWLVGAVGALLVAAVVAVVLVSTNPPAGGAAVVTPKPPEVKPIDLKRDLRMVFTDMVNVSQRSDVEWYRVAITDMLITQLSQMPGLKLPTRDEMLWKIREKDATVNAVSDQFQEFLLKEFSPKLYFTGNYVVQGGMVRVSVKCFKSDAGSFRQVFVKQFERPEVEFFKLIDDMAATILQELQTNAETILAMNVPPSDGVVLKPCEEVFAANYLPTSRDGEMALAESGFAAKKSKEASDGFKQEEMAKGGWTEGKAQDKAMGRSVQKMSVSHNGRRMNRGEEHKWVYAVQLACEQIQDRSACETLKRAVLQGEASPEAIKKLNDSLRKFNKPLCVKLACKKCGTGSECSGCPGEMVVQVIQGAADPAPAAAPAAVEKEK
jgi:serine/threonine protein kinase